ncbi:MULTISPECIES: hypothetical protein [Providencia]|uniref:Uncharacterized protein n=1 Tax=Providencia rettgeri TaxID=587 RepID=A0A379FKQ9_PRORE|nr:MULTISPECIES: hypothetical protein [Providencia]ELR5116227.1 hypothetical protein [Providencia rettgeri]MCG5279705.1 hypothetical protein [Providencia rettgeri]QXB06259.1 hypothetical protein I6L80_03030 [Providencia rettgeri]SUC29271.1 Uncharacterised protein [Providencia rettgeri]HBK4772743.1 hypothetical protein [Providencia rettgeri]
MMSMSSIHSPCKTSINNINHNQKISSGFSNQLNKIIPSGTESLLPKNNIKNEINISGDVNELHASNHQQQIEEITQLLSSSDRYITYEMVEKALNAGGHGCTLQQEINHRPESALVVLTLFEPQEIPRALLSAATELVKSISTTNLSKDKNVKDILNSQQEKVDTQLANFLLTKGNNDLVTRYQEKYVSPAIKHQLTAYFPDNEIQSHSVDKFLVTEANEQLDSDISKLIMEYNKVPANQYGDKYQQLNNIFRSIEKKIGIIMPLKVKMNLTASVKQESSDNKLPSDEVDGLTRQLVANPSRTVANSYNTTTIINNYASLPLSENAEQVSYQGADVSTEQEHPSSNTHENDKPFDINEPLLQRNVTSPQRGLNTRETEPAPDYDFLNSDAQNDQKVEIIKSNVHLESLNGEPLSVEEEDAMKSIEERFKSSVKLASKSNQPMDIKPKFGSHYGSYLIDKKVPEGVKLTNNRELVQEKSTKPAETDSFLSIKNASHYRTSYIDGNAKVVLSAEGLMTRNLNEKLDYAKQS